MFYPVLPTGEYYTVGCAAPMQAGLLPSVFGAQQVRVVSLLCAVAFTHTHTHTHTTRAQTGPAGCTFTAGAARAQQAQCADVRCVLGGAAQRSAVKCVKSIDVET